MTELYGSAPIYMNSKAKEEWDSLDPSVKEAVMKNLDRAVEKMTLKISVELISCVIMDLEKRVQILEDRIKNGMENNRNFA